MAKIFRYQISGYIDITADTIEQANLIANGKTNKLGTWDVQPLVITDFDSKKGSFLYARAVGNIPEDVTQNY